MKNDICLGRLADDQLKHWTAVRIALSNLFGGKLTPTIMGSEIWVRKADRITKAEIDYLRGFVDGMLQIL